MRDVASLRAESESKESPHAGHCDQIVGDSCTSAERGSGPSGEDVHEAQPCYRPRGWLHSSRELGDMYRDLRFALRVLVGNPAFALTAILSIALGIAACTAVFSFAYTLLLRPLSAPGAEQLVSIYGVSRSKGSLLAVSTPDYHDLAVRTDVFESVGAYFRSPVFVEVDGGADRVNAELPTGNHHQLIGVRAVLGRMLGAGDDRPGAPAVVVISESFWRRRMAARQDAIGRVVRISGRAFEIVGVAPASFKGVLLDWYGAPDLWLPLSSAGTVFQRIAKSSPEARRDFRWLQVTARLRPGVTVEAATAALRAQGEQLSRVWAATNGDVTFMATLSAHARFWPERRGSVIGFAVVLIAMVGGMLLIAVLNVANLLVARMHTRQREISIRLALGAERAVLVRQMLIEGVLLSTVATLTSVPLTMGLTMLLTKADLPFFVATEALDLSPDWRVFTGVALLCAACGAMLGVMPAWHAWRADVRSGLAATPPISRRTRFGTWDARHVLAALQIAVCLVVTLGAGLLTKKLITLRSVELGYATAGVTLFDVESYLLDAPAERQRAIAWDLLARARRVGGVESAALAFKALPSTNIGTQTIAALDAIDARHRQGLDLRFNVVSTGYFGTLGIPLVAGRDFDERDERPGAAPAAVLNATAARKLWNDPARAIGRRVRTTDAQKRVTEREVIGVVRDAIYAELDEARMPYLFVPMDRTWNGAVVLHVRGPLDSAPLVAHLRRELHALAPALAFSSVGSLDRYVAGRIAAPTLAARLSLAASAIGVTLAVIGLYAALSFLVAQRRTDLAIRMAIGASPRQIAWLIARFGAAIGVAGISIGLFVAYVAMRGLASQVRGIDIYDPAVYAAVVAFLTAATAVACFVPASRAAGTEPWKVLARR